jgi:hypothetical protein
MMRDTPRMFVGPAVFELDRERCGDAGDAVRREIARIAGISRCELDRVAAILLVTAHAPVDRSRIVEILDRLGVGLQR